MRIAYVYDAVYPWVKGGAEKRIYELSRRLVQRGHEVHCYGIKWWDGDRDILREGVYHHGICPPMDLYAGGRRSMKEAVCFGWKLLGALEDRYDVVDCQEFPYLPCFSARVRTPKEGLFITWHEVWGDYWYEYLGRKGFIGKVVERSVSRLSANNIAVSERTKLDLTALGVEGVRVVPNGIDLERIERVKASGAKSDFVFAGRLLRHKNVDLLIEALDLVRGEMPNVGAVIVGGGPLEAELRGKARDLGLERNVEFKGFLDSHDEVISLMKASRVFVLPSTREGFGMVALEANACGIPVVTFDHPMNATRDLVKGSGLICLPNSKDLAQAMLEALKRAEEMRSSCLELSRRYDWRRICDLAEEGYKGRSD